MNSPLHPPRTPTGPVGYAWVADRLGAPVFPGTPGGRSPQCRGQQPTGAGLCVPHRAKPAPKRRHSRSCGRVIRAPGAETVRRAHGRATASGQPAAGRPRPARTCRNRLLSNLTLFAFQNRGLSKRRRKQSAGIAGKRANPNQDSAADPERKSSIRRTPGVILVSFLVGCGRRLTAAASCNTRTAMRWWLRRVRCCRT